MASRCTAHALADVGAAAVCSAKATPKSVVTPMAGFASTGSAPTSLAESVAAVTVAPSASEGVSPEPASLANSAPKSVDTAMAGFAPGSWEPASAAIAGSGSATGDPRPH
jgi:hypothetical protein